MQLMYIDTSTSRRELNRFVLSKIKMIAPIFFGLLLCVTSTGYSQDHRWPSMTAPDDTVPTEESGQIEQHLTHPKVNSLTVFWIPALGMEADIDSDEPGGDIKFGADVETGSGWDLRYERQDKKGSFGLGAMYMGSRHTERITDADVDIHAAYLTFNCYF